MKLFAGGVRGTRVVADGAYAGFGGDTTCYLVTGADGKQIIVDAGTGLRSVASRLRADRVSPVRLLFTHYHLDHVIGFPNFAPLYKDGQVVEIAGPSCEGSKPVEILRRLFTPAFWPVAMDALNAELRISTLQDSAAAQAVGGMEVRWRPVRHPGGCVAYRFDEPATGQSLLIATDMEWALSSTGERDGFLRFCTRPRPPDLLLLDGQFTPSNYEPFRGWGHSRWSDSVEIALLAGAETLAVIHHDPNHADSRMEEIEREIRSAHPRGFLLRQGSEIDVELPP